MKGTTCAAGAAPRREGPILFNLEMIRSQRAGRKTMTRRVMKPRVLELLRVAAEAGECSPFLEDGRPIRGDNEYAAQFCPYGQSGDRLWVRETFATLCPGSYEEEKPRAGAHQDVRYKATDRMAEADADIRGYQWRPSIYMPRWASRTLLEVTAVRVERVQDISEEDAIREGITGPHNVGYPAYWCPGDSKARYSRASAAFESLWDSISANPKPLYENGRVASYVSYPWENIHEEREHRGLPWEVIGNPWVWVVQFKELEEKTA